MSFEIEKKIIIGAIILFFFIVGCVAISVFVLHVNGSKIEMKNMEKNRAQENNQTEEIIANKKEILQERKVEILFGGDMMFDRYIRTVIERKGFDFIFQDLKPEFENVDLVVANLEGVITNNDSVSVATQEDRAEHFKFTFPMQTAEKLFSHNIKVVNIGNNHINNFGADGVEQTRASLKKADMKYFGDPGNAEFRSYLKEHNGIKLGFVCYNRFWSDALSKALSDTEGLKEKVDVVIVYAHWGQEYKTRSNEKQGEVARALIDVGADLIIGSHPHVVQETGEYKGKKIYYSLGNMVFDQYFSKETQEGLLVKVKITKKNEEQPDLEFKERRVELLTSGKTVPKI